MKRRISILSVLVICLATLVAGTIAYFTAEEKAHNVITTGGVKSRCGNGPTKRNRRPLKM